LAGITETAYPGWINMNTATNPVDLIRSALLDPSGGIVGLVDTVLTVCGAHGLQLNWQAERCCVRSAAGDWKELLGIPMRASVFRAVLARVAVLCNEHTPDSVSPYGGQGELRGGANPPAEFSVQFVNSPDERRIEIITKAYLADAENRNGHV
jgi:hypothetical protein